MSDSARRYLEEAYSLLLPPLGLEEGSDLPSRLVRRFEREADPELEVPLTGCKKVEMRLYWHLGVSKRRKPEDRMCAG